MASNAEFETVIADLLKLGSAAGGLQPIPDYLGTLAKRLAAHVELVRRAQAAGVALTAEQLAAFNKLAELAQEVTWLREDGQRVLDLAIALDRSIPRPS